MRTGTQAALGSLRAEISRLSGKLTTQHRESNPGVWAMICMALTLLFARWRR